MGAPVYALWMLVTLLMAPLAEARVLPPQDHAGTELRWRSYAELARQTRPAMVFPHAQCFRQAAASHGLPETLLLAVARGESDFDAQARSKANARGLMQILWPSTARHLGITRLSDLLEPCTNVDAGARYLKELSKRYRGNVHRMLAAYNYGPGRIPVEGGELPNGAVWYSAYILRHLEYVLNAGRDDDVRDYADQGKLQVIRFARPWRAAAFVESLQSKLGKIRLDWFRRADGKFEVVMTWSSREELLRGKQVLKNSGMML